MSYRRYVLRRVAHIVLVLFGLATLVFLITRTLPGDPARIILGPRASEEAIQRLREQLGLTDPLPVQYVNFIDGLLSGDLGMSVTTRNPVMQDIVIRLPATMELTTAAIVIAIGVGVPLGVVSGVNKDSWLDHFSRMTALSGVSIPEFWSGIMLQLIVGAWLSLLPISGRIGDGLAPPDATGFYVIDSLLAWNMAALQSALLHLLMPAFVLSLPALAQIMRLVRSAMAEQAGREYIRIASANGMNRNLLVYKYMLKNSFTSALTLIGLTYGFSLGNAFVVELVFAWPGLGQYGVQALFNSDFNAIIGVTVVVGVWFTLINLFVDLAYGFLDPRIRYD